MFYCSQARKAEASRKGESRTQKRDRPGRKGPGEVRRGEGREGGTTADGEESALPRTRATFSREEESEGSGWGQARCHTEEKPN